MATDRDLLERIVFRVVRRALAAPGCSGQRDLGREPARAVELLTKGPALLVAPPAAD